MKREAISKALDNIADRHIEEALDYKAEKKPNSWVKWAALAACVCLVVGISLPIALEHFAPSKKCGHGGITHLEYVGAYIPPVETEQGTVIFNEITDMDAYRKFNTFYDYNGELYYPVRGTAGHIAMDGANGFDINTQNRPLEDEPDYPKLVELNNSSPDVGKIVMNLLEHKAASPYSSGVSVQFNVNTGAPSISFSTYVNSHAVVICDEDIARIDDRFNAVLPIFKSTLGTENSTYIGDQEVSIHYFYYSSPTSNGGTAECYIYYAYFEKNGIEYLYEFSSLSTYKMSSELLEIADPQGECLQAFIDYLLTILA